MKKQLLNGGSSHYVQLGPLDFFPSEASSKWWRAPEGGGHAALRRPTELTLNAIEVTLNGAVTSISITREELLTIVSAEELRHMLLVDTTAQKRVRDPLYAQYCHFSSEEQESSHRTISANHGPAFTFKL